MDGLSVWSSVTYLDGGKRWIDAMSAGIHRWMERSYTRTCRQADPIRTSPVCPLRTIHASKPSAKIRYPCMHPSIHGSHASIIHAGTRASPHASDARPYLLLSSFETVGDLKTGPIHTDTSTYRQDKKTVSTKCGVRERGREIDTAQTSPL